MYIEKAIKKINEAKLAYDDGLIHEAEFVNVGIDVFVQMRDRLTNEASDTLNILGSEHVKSK